MNKERTVINESLKQAYGAAFEGGFQKDAFTNELDEYMRLLTVVTSPIEKYQLLGPLKEGEHYLTFPSPEECLEKTEILFRNNYLRLKMQLANRAYYEDWLHPGEKILKILQLVKQ